jgi:hypothetical protein
LAESGSVSGSAGWGAAQGRRRRRLALRQERQDRLQEQPAVAQQAVADGRLGRHIGIVGDLQEPGARRQVPAGHERVVAEHRRADHDHQVVAGELLAQWADPRRQEAGMQPVGFRKRCAFGEGYGPYRCSEALGDGDALVPGLVARNVGAVDEDRPGAGVDAAGELGQALRVGADARGDAAHAVAAGHVGGHLLVPVVERQREVDRAGRRLQGGGIGAHEGAGHVLRAGRLVAPFHPWPRHGDGVDVGQQRLEQQHLARLLAGGDDQRRLVLVGRQEAAHGVAQPGGGVDIHEHRLAQPLGEAVGDADDARLLQRQHEAEVIRKVLEECLLGRSRIADDGGEPKLAKQVVGDILDGGHDGSGSYAVFWSSNVRTRTPSSSNV